MFSERAFLAMCRKAGVLGRFEKVDASDLLDSVDGIFDEVDAEVSMATGIAAGTPIFETYTEWVGDRFGNGDILILSGTRFVIRGAVMVDTSAGTSSFTLSRRAS